MTRCRFRRCGFFLLRPGPLLAVATGLLVALTLPLPARAQRPEPISPLPLDGGVERSGQKINPGKVALGNRLFHDPRLSRDNTLSCASCHDLAANGADLSARPLSLGVGGAKGAVNAPTVFNARFNFRQFWDGRSPSLTDQVNGPVNNPVEMATRWPDVMAKLGKDSALVAQFKAIYPDGMQPQNVADAIAAYEMTLTTPNARFDKWLRGDKSALTDSEVKGYQLFKSYGCVACHQGVNIGGNLYQTFGVMGNYFGARGNPTTADDGRFNVTRNPADRHVFKVPSLRNVAVTPPYFHDGTARTLDQAVDVMFRYQLGRSAPPEDKALIVGFLRTLTGEYQGKPLSGR